MNMEKDNTLGQYLTSHKNVDELNSIFLNLDFQLKYLHSQGYYVEKLDLDNILLEEATINSYPTQVFFSFKSLAKINNPQQDKSENIKALSKLAVGSYISVMDGFCDYSKISDNYIKNYFEEIKNYIPNYEYYENVIINGDTSLYYSDYVKNQSESTKGNHMQMVKSTIEGKLYSTDEDSAFVRIIFYPVMIIAFVTITMLFYTIFH